MNRVSYNVVRSRVSVLSLTPLWLTGGIYELFENSQAIAIIFSRLSLLLFALSMGAVFPQASTARVIVSAIDPALAGAVSTGFEGLGVPSGPAGVRSFAFVLGGVTVSVKTSPADSPVLLDCSVRNNCTLDAWFSPSADITLTFTPAIKAFGITGGGEVGFSATITGDQGSETITIQGFEFGQFFGADQIGGISKVTLTAVYIAEWDNMVIVSTSLTLTPATATNPAGSDHTVTATVTSTTPIDAEDGMLTPPGGNIGDHTVLATQTTGDGGVSGDSVHFEVIEGPNAGTMGTVTTDSNGQASFTYTDTKGVGVDKIQASIGEVVSNVVEKIWTFDPFGGIIRTPRRNLLLTLVRPRPDASGVRCVETDDPTNPDFDTLPFTPFAANGEADIALQLSNGAGTKTVCCEFITTAITTAQSILGPAGFCSDIALAPDDLQARPKIGKVDLTWTPSEGADSYNVLRALTSGGPYQTLGTSTNGVFADFTATAGQTFFYVVQAVGSGETANSNEVQVTVPTKRR